MINCVFFIPFSNTRNKWNQEDEVEKEEEDDADDDDDDDADEKKIQNKSQRGLEFSRLNGLPTDLVRCCA